MKADADPGAGSALQRYADPHHCFNVDFVPQNIPEDVLIVVECKAARAI